MARIILLFVIIQLFLIPGCGPSEPPAPTDEVTLQLKWVHQAQFAGFYVAQEKGYYARENIKIKFLEGGPDVDITERVVSGQADFGVQSPEFIIMARSEGKPLKAIATLYPRSALVFVSLASSNIVRPADFLGKTVATQQTAGSIEFELQFTALMNKLGLDPSKVNIVPYDPAYAGLLDGSVDVTPLYSTGGLIRLRQKVSDLNLIWPSDYGIHFYSDTLVATDKLISEKPGLVTRFLRATLDGWRDAMEDYPQAVETTLKYAEIADPKLQTDMIQAMLLLAHSGEDRIGWMKPATWREMAGLMERYGLPVKSVNVDELYTMRFIEEIAGETAR